MIIYTRLFVCWLVGYPGCDFLNIVSPIFMKFGTDVHFRERGQGQHLENLKVSI